MKYKHAKQHLLILISIITGGCRQESKLSFDKADVKITVDRFATFWERKDTAMLSKIFDHNPQMINYGAEQTEVFVGYKALHDSLLQVLPHFSNIRVNVRNQKINYGPSNDVAWFSEIMDWKLKYNGKSETLNDQRVTGVLQNKNGTWVIVQFQVGIPSVPHI